MLIGMTAKRDEVLAWAEKAHRELRDYFAKVEKPSS